MSDVQVGVELRVQSPDAHASGMDDAASTAARPTVSAETPRQLYRIKHDAELGAPWRQDPEVFRFRTHDFAPFTREMQWFAFRLLLQAAGDVFSDEDLKRAFTSLYGWRTVITNMNGFGNDDDPRANFVTGEHLNCAPPKIANLVFGGNVLAGEEVGTELIARTLDSRNSIPDDVTRESHPWLIHLATIAQLDGRVIRFPQLSDPVRGIYRDVPVPIFSKVEARFPLSQLIKLPLGSEVPSPYR